MPSYLPEGSKEGHSTIQNILHYFEFKTSFLGSFAKFRKVTISFVVSVHLSVRPSVRITRLPLGGYA